MMRFRNRFFSAFSLIIFGLSVAFSTFSSEVQASAIKQNDELIERIARDFSKKFCNGVGFGLSQESAVNFAMKENMAIFNKKKGFENIYNKAIVEKVSIAVVDKCGYPLNLSEDQWGNTFIKSDLN